jgi:hypothetical protein
MCFSAGASFGASAVLGTLSVATLKNVKGSAQVPFAMIPLMFAVQQAAEGMLWIGLSGTEHESWRHFPIYIFLIFAQLIWPIWVPLSIWRLERDQARRKILAGLLAMGIIISAYLLYCMFVYDIKAEIHEGHIRYILNFPLAFAAISSVFYFMPTVLPLFISSFKGMWQLGLAVLSSFIVTKIYFDEHLISVWCFFAAIISMLILIMLILSRREADRQAKPVNETTL